MPLELHRRLPIPDARDEVDDVERPTLGDGARQVARQAYAGAAVVLDGVDPTGGNP
jgi:hypothetical protein